MNVVRSALTANNVVGLPNKRDYIHKERHRLMEERRQRLLASSIARDEAMNSSNVSVDVQHAVMDDYESPNEDEEMEDEDEVMVDVNTQAANAAPGPRNEDRNDDPQNDRRFGGGHLRPQRYGSHHEIRRRG